MILFSLTTTAFLLCNTFDVFCSVVHTEIALCAESLSNSKCWQVEFCLEVGEAEVAIAARTLEELIVGALASDCFDFVFV